MSDSVEEGAHCCGPCERGHESTNSFDCYVPRLIQFRLEDENRVMRQKLEQRIPAVRRQSHLLLTTSGPRACGHSCSYSRDAKILPLFVRRKNLQKVFLACVIGVTSNQQRSRILNTLQKSLGVLLSALQNGCKGFVRKRPRSCLWNKSPAIVAKAGPRDTQKFAM